MEARRRKAAEMILQSEIVTASLEDDEAEVLLSWHLGWLKVMLSPAEMWETRKHLSISPQVWVKFAA